MSARPRSATPAGASSSRLGIWEAIAARGRRHPLDSRLRRRTFRLRAPRGARAGDRGLRLRRGQSRHGRGACGGSSASAPELTLRVPARLTQLKIAAGGRRAHASRTLRARASASAPASWWPPTAPTRRCASPPASTPTVEDYGQVALVANVATDEPHAGRAFERFTPAGPLAVLPLHDGARAVIWACTPERAQHAAGAG